MPSRNETVVRSIYADWERGDYSSTHWQHPNIEFVMADGPNPGRWRGAAGISQGWGDFLSAWEHFRMAAEAYQEIDSARVLVLFHFSGRGKASGLEIEQTGSKAAGLFELREHRVERITLYFDRSPAMTALRLDG